MLLDTIQQYLVAHGVTATIYIDFLAAEPHEALCLRGYGGMASTDKEYDHPNIQVVSRALDYNTAKQNAQTVYLLLHMHNQYDGIDKTVDIFAIQPPYFSGRDDLKRYTFVNNYRCEIKR